MQYRGNPKLAEDLQGRIISSFEQALDHANQGKDQEARLGCEFILNMDPLFEPARMLVERLESDQRPIHTADLRPRKAGEVTKSMEGLVDVTITDADLDELDALGDLDDFADLTLDEPDSAPVDPVSPTLPMDAPAPLDAAAPAEVPASEASGPSTASTGLGAVLQDLLSRRNFQQVLQIAESQQDTIAQAPELQSMVTQAREMQETDAFVGSFLESAQKAHAAGDREEAGKLLDKARALDSEHAGVLELTELLAAPPVAAEPEAEESPLDLDDLGELDDIGSLGGTDLSFDNDDALSGSLPPLDTDFLDDEDDDPLGTVSMDAVATVEAPPMVRGPEAGQDQGPVASGIEAEEDDDSQGRIDELLQQGQDAFDQGQYQSAIDIWSRIFLMDLDHQEAQDRIDQARSKKAEEERRAEELFHEGLGHLEQQDAEQAQASFRQVLAINPGHRKAKELLEQLEAGQMPEVGDLLSSGDMLPNLESAGLEEPMPEVEGSPSMEAAVERDRVVAVKKTDWRLVSIGAALFLLVAAGGAFLWSKKDELFPNSKPSKGSASANARSKPDPLARAKAMHEGGNTENGINLLRRIQPGDPKFAEAEALIAEWTAALEAEAEPEVPEGPSEATVARHQLLLKAANEAFSRQHYIRAARYLERAAKLLPLEEKDLLLKRDCADKLEPLADSLDKFEQGEYATILPGLWREYDRRPEDNDLKLLIVDSYYNLALRDLQRGNAKLAAEKMKEAMLVEPENDELERLRLFSQAYSDESQDLLYRIFVKYLPSR